MIRLGRSEQPDWVAPRSRLCAMRARSPDKCRALSDATKVRGHEILLAIDRTLPLEGLGLQTVSVLLEDGHLQPGAYE